MRSGLGLGVRSRFGGEAFNPATLSLTGWWRANYGGSPWAPTASAGSSGTNGNLTEATNPPSTGSAVNGLTPADFDGTNDILNAPGTADTFFNAQSFSGWALFNADAVDTNDALPYQNDGVITTRPSAYLHVWLKSTGAIGVRFVTGVGEAVPSTTFTIGAWTLVQWTYDGANIRIRVNGGAWASAAQTGNFGDLTNTLHVGQNYDGVGKLDGKILEVGLSDTVISDANFDNVRSYCTSRYGVSV